MTTPHTPAPAEPALGTPEREIWDAGFVVGCHETQDNLKSWAKECIRQAAGAIAAPDHLNSEHGEAIVEECARLVKDLFAAEVAPPLSECEHIARAVLSSTRWNSWHRTPGLRASRTNSSGTCPHPPVCHHWRNCAAQEITDLLDEAPEPAGRGAADGTP